MQGGGFFLQFFSSVNYWTELVPELRFIKETTLIHCMALHAWGVE